MSVEPDLQFKRDEFHVSDDCRIVLIETRTLSREAR
jgi:hypothetical protein